MTCREEDTVTPEQIAVLSGLVATVVISLLKLIKGYQATPALTKILSTVVASILATLAATGWQATPEVLWQIALAILTALGTYQALSAPLSRAIAPETTPKPCDPALTPGNDAGG